MAKGKAVLSPAPYARLTAGSRQSPSAHRQPTMESSGAAAAFEAPTGERIPIRGNCAIGRSPANEVVVPDERVSRRHALVHVQEGGEYWLVDLGSGNGTYVNGRRLTRPTRLKDGDEIEIGPFRQVFRELRHVPESGATGTMAGSTVLMIRPTKCWLLVADIESSVELAKSLTPDQVPVVTGRWLAECKQTIEDCGGMINKFLGDGFLAYWHDRGKAAPDVARAVQALVRLQAAASPRFRVVVHYGEVYVGGAGSMGEESLSGSEVNLAFRMEKLAGSLHESCLLSEPAKELLKDLVTTEAAGQHELPGFEGTYNCFRVVTGA